MEGEQVIKEYKIGNTIIKVYDTHILTDEQDTSAVLKRCADIL